MIVQRILKKLTQSSRLDEYKNLLELALQKGYKITSLSDWYENDFYKGEKVLLLRHDVDLLSSTAYKMFMIEKSLNVKSTFYFRWLTINSKIMNTMLKEGFEVSLHYETLATYCKQHKIFSSQEVTHDVLRQCLILLKNEIQTFQERFGKVKTLCSHGDRRNRVIGIPNHRLLESIDRKELGIYFEAYDQEIISKINVYISDSSINNNHNWKYGKTPEAAMGNGTECICILTHPHHWHYNLSTNIIRLMLEIKDNTVF